MERILVAYWRAENGIDESASRVYSTFSVGHAEYVVVFDFEKDDYSVRLRQDCIVIRKETPR